eukprot:jgi/Hompol1/4165/HPOL_003507-RA
MIRPIQTALEGRGNRNKLRGRGGANFYRNAADVHAVDPFARSRQPFQPSKYYSSATDISCIMFVKKQAVSFKHTGSDAQTAQKAAFQSPTDKHSQISDQTGSQDSPAPVVAHEAESAIADQLQEQLHIHAESKLDDSAGPGNAATADRLTSIRKSIDAPEFVPSVTFWPNIATSQFTSPDSQTAMIEEGQEEVYLNDQNIEPRDSSAADEDEEPHHHLSQHSQHSHHSYQSHPSEHVHETSQPRMDPLPTRSQGYPQPYPYYSYTSMPMYMPVAPMFSYPNNGDPLSRQSRPKLSDP